MGARAELKIKTAKKEESGQFREMKEAFVREKRKDSENWREVFERDGPWKQND